MPTVYGMLDECPVPRVCEASDRLVSSMLGARQVSGELLGAGEVSGTCSV